MLTNLKLLICSERPKSKDGEPMVYRLKDWPSGEEFMALMPSRYTDVSLLLNCYIWVVKLELKMPMIQMHKNDVGVNMSFNLLQVWRFDEEPSSAWIFWSRGEPQSGLPPAVFLCQAGSRPTALLCIRYEGNTRGCIKCVGFSSKIHDWSSKRNHVCSSTVSLTRC